MWGSSKVAGNFFTSCKICYSGKTLRHGDGTEVVTVVITNNTVTPWDLVDSCRRFRWSYYLPVRCSRSQTLNDSSLQRSVWFVCTAEVSPFSSIQTLNDWSSSYVPEGPQRKSEWRIHIINCAPMYVQGSSIAIQTPAQWNLIGRSMTAPPPVLSPSSILPPLIVSLRSCYRKKKHSARV
jgi:hypothetical protein